MTLGVWWAQLEYLPFVERLEIPAPVYYSLILITPITLKLPIAGFIFDDIIGAVTIHLASTGAKPDLVPIPIARIS